jgi:hypothetical protein
MADSFVAEYDFTVDSDLSPEALQGRNIAGDETFYSELERVLGNLKLIRAAQPNCGVLVSFVENAAGEKYKITLQ